MDAWLGLRDARGRLWRGGVAKFFADGVIDSGHGVAGGARHARRGGELLLARPGAVRARRSRSSPGAGFQVATHTIGDAAVRFVLDAYVRAGGRHRLEHLETLPDDLVEAIARAGVVASMQPVHLAALRGDGTGNWNERLGPERAARAFRMRDLIDAGALLTLGQRLAGGRGRPAARARRRAAAAAAAGGASRAARPGADGARGAGRLHASPRRWSRARRVWPGASAWGCAPTSRAYWKIRSTCPRRSSRTTRCGSPSSAGGSCIAQLFQP